MNRTPAIKADAMAGPKGRAGANFVLEA